MPMCGGAPWPGWNNMSAWPGNWGACWSSACCRAFAVTSRMKMSPTGGSSNVCNNSAPLAMEQGVTVVIEPVNHHQVGFNHTAAEVAALVGRVASPAISYMLDTIHMHQEERAPLTTIAEHGDKIHHFHLADSHGGPLGEGNIDFAAALTTLQRTGYDGFVSVKVYRKQPWRESARSAAEYLRKLGYLA